VVMLTIINQKLYIGTHNFLKPTKIIASSIRVLQQLTVMQVVKKFAACNETQKYITIFSTGHHLEGIYICGL